MRNGFSNESLCEVNLLCEDKNWNQMCFLNNQYYTLKGINKIQSIIIICNYHDFIPEILSWYQWMSLWPHQHNSIHIIVHGCQRRKSIKVSASVRIFKINLEIRIRIQSIFIQHWNGNAANSSLFPYDAHSWFSMATQTVWKIVRFCLCCAFVSIFILGIMCIPLYHVFKHFGCQWMQECYVLLWIQK